MNLLAVLNLKEKEDQDVSGGKILKPPGDARNNWHYPSPSFFISNIEHTLLLHIASNSKMKELPISDANPPIELSIDEVLPPAKNKPVTYPSYSIALPLSTNPSRIPNTLPHQLRRAREVLPQADEIDIPHLRLS